MNALINEYETLFEDAFWGIANDTLAEQFEKIDPDECSQKIQKDLEEWFVTPNALSSGNTPLEFVASLDDEATLLFLELIFEYSSEVIPFYASALEPKKEFLFETLKKMFSEECSDGVFFELCMLFSIYKDARALDLYIDFITTASDEQVDLVDFLQGLLVNFGETATARFLNIVKDSRQFEGRIENIYSAISHSGAKNDEAFEALKRLFDNAPKKSYAAICLGVYGDVRAVKILADWLEQLPQDSYDREEVGDVLSALKNLERIED